MIRVGQLVSRAAGHRWPALLDRAKCGRSGWGSDKRAGDPGIWDL